MSPSACDLQKLVNLCVDEFDQQHCDMCINASVLYCGVCGLAQDIPNSVLRCDARLASGLL